MKNKFRFVALLRGINVGGNHKVPMGELRTELATLGFYNISTLLNSGNIVFDAHAEQPEKYLEEKISSALQSKFGFAIPVMVRKSEAIQALANAHPFEHLEVTKDTRLYISFLKEIPTIDLPLPWLSPDGSYRILTVHDRTICSVLDLAVTKTPKGMDALEQLFGKNITTRNWNTINRIVEKINS